jgi:hypothetical protein
MSEQAQAELSGWDYLRLVLLGAVFPAIFLEVRLRR